MNLAMSRSDTEKRTLVCPAVGFVGSSLCLGQQAASGFQRENRGRPTACMYKDNVRRPCLELCLAAWCDLQNHVRTVLRRRRTSLCLELPRCCGARPLSLQQR